MYVLQTNISKLYYFVNVVLLIFYFLSYISKQNLCKQNLRIDQFYLTLFRMGRGQIQLPLLPSPLASDFVSLFSVRVTTLTLIFILWEMFGQFLRMKHLLQCYFPLAQERGINAKNCQKMSQTNADARKEDLSRWELFLSSKVLYYPGLLTWNASSLAFMVQEITRG